MTPTHNRLEATSQKKDVMKASSQESDITPSKVTSSAKRSSAKQGNLNYNLLSRSKDKSYITETMSWSSLPPNLLKPGKVPEHYTMFDISTHDFDMLNISIYYFLL